MTEDFKPHLTADGSFSFFSTEFGEAFHSDRGARLEAELKFVIPTQLAQKAKSPRLQLLDICYGLGYNTAAALETIWTNNPNCYVEWIGLELDLIVAQAALPHHQRNAWQPEILKVLADLSTNCHSQSDRHCAQLLIGDARQTLQQACNQPFKADAIFLDPFSPPHCPQLWTVEFLALAAQCLKPDGRLATYSCAASVRVALMQAGLTLGSTAPFGRRSPGTVASFIASDFSPLSQQEQEHLQTRAAIPYRDPNLSDRADTIHQRRESEQQASSLEPTSRWKKRWSSPTEIRPTET